MDTTGDGSAKKGEVDLGNVVISEEETPVADLPASVSVIEGEELERVPFKKGIDILRAVPNLLATDYNQGGVPGEFVLRGFSGGHGNVAAVFVDGAPLNESNSHADGIADFNIIIPEEIERIEVIRGPFSALYGNYARGGALISLQRKRSMRTPPIYRWDTGIPSGES
ncbi:MAG: Plug domain-containing protein [Candidatus Manganitrophus sp.]|nr:MAG: Plug domain-containing protein [Candidatus Manganitrophus sp.]